VANEKRLIDAERFNRILQNFEGHLLEAGKTEGAEAVKTIIKGLKTEPTVDAVEVVHGHWIEHPNAEMHNGKWVSNYECSECCCFYRTHENYCGYCGAKMDGDGNGT
jgi:hypothetical protein